MSKENNVIGALVKLAVCPGKKGCSDYCGKCEYRTIGNVCHRELQSDCMHVLQQYDFAAPQQNAVQQSDEVTRVISDREVSAVMHYLGIPANLRGYRYIRSAIIRTISDYHVVQAITKELYPAIAEEFGTTGSRVERAIRHAIEVMWERCDIEILHKLFGNSVSFSKDKPTNAEFISIMAECISTGIFDHLF